MCINSKQIVNLVGRFSRVALMIACVSVLITPLSSQAQSLRTRPLDETAAGLTPGDSIGGVIDRVYVMAPPNWSYILETQAGSFVDCGDDTRNGLTDEVGRSELTMTCGVTITETLVIPAASRSARIVIHH